MPLFVIVPPVPLPPLVELPPVLIEKSPSANETLYAVKIEAGLGKNSTISVVNE